MLPSNQVIIQQPQTQVLVSLMTQFHPHPLVTQAEFTHKWNCRAITASPKGICLSGQKKGEIQPYNYPSYRCIYANCNFELCLKCAQANVSSCAGVLSTLHSHLLYEVKNQELVIPCCSKSVNRECQGKPSFFIFGNYEGKKYECASPDCKFWLCGDCLSSTLVPTTKFKLNVHPHELYGVQDMNPWNCSASIYFSKPCLRGHSSSQIPQLRPYIRFTCFNPLCNLSICDLCMTSFGQYKSDNNIKNQNTQFIITQSEVLNSIQLQRSYMVNNSAISYAPSNNNNFSNNSEKIFLSYLHNHPLYLSPLNNKIGWFCSSLILKKQCLRNHAMKFEFHDHPKYECKIPGCDFSLCDLCLETSINNNAKAEIKSINPQLPDKSIESKANPTFTINKKIEPIASEEKKEDKSSSDSKFTSLFKWPKFFTDKNDKQSAKKIKVEEFESKVVLLPDEKRGLMNELIGNLILELEQCMNTGIYQRENLGEYYVSLCPELDEFLSIKELGKNTKIFDKFKLKNIHNEAKQLQKILNS